MLSFTIAGGAAAVLAMVAGLNPGGVRDRIWGRAARAPIQSLAVLPLTNLSGEPAQEYFADGLTDALIGDLSQISALKVISRTSSMQYKQTKKSMPEIARELGVDAVIEGTVQRSGERVRVTAQLIQGATDKHIWANAYERDMRDVFALERDVTQDIAHQVQVRLSSEAQSPPQPKPVEPKALDAYLHGNYHLNRYGEGSGQEEKEKAADYFQQAIDVDPHFALAYYGLAYAHLDLLWPSDQDIKIARTAAERALEIDPNSLEGLTMLGYVKIRRWDFPGAVVQFRRALALSPRNAAAHDGYSYWLLAMGRTEESLHEAEIAQQLNPAGNLLPMALYFARDYDRSIAVSLTLIQSDPTAANLHWDLSRTYSAKAMYKDSVAELEKMLNLFGAPETADRIHQAFLISGYRGARQEYAKELESLIAIKKAYLPVELAEVYATLGDKERAFHWLEEAYKHREAHWAGVDYRLEWINAELQLDSLRSDPRFEDLLRRIGLPT